MQLALFLFLLWHLFQKNKFKKSICSSSLCFQGLCIYSVSTLIRKVGKVPSQRHGAGENMQMELIGTEDPGVENFSK